MKAKALLFCVEFCTSFHLVEKLNRRLNCEKCPMRACIVTSIPATPAETGSWIVKFNGWRYKYAVYISIVKSTPTGLVWFCTRSQRARCPQLFFSLRLNRHATLMTFTSVYHLPRMMHIRCILSICQKQNMQAMLFVFMGCTLFVCRLAFCCISAWQYWRKSQKACALIGWSFVDLLTHRVSQLIYSSATKQHLWLKSPIVVQAV